MVDGLFELVVPGTTEEGTAVIMREQGEDVM